MNKTLLVGIACLAYTISFSQTLVEIPFDHKVNNCNLIVEGKVIAQESFWNTEHTRIYTSNKIEIFKIFKGTETNSFIEVVTLGGVVGDRFMKVSDLLQLNVGNTGVFFCQPTPLNLKARSKRPLFDIYSSSQGFYKYELGKQTANSPFHKNVHIINTLYKQLQSRAGRSYENKNLNFKVSGFAKINLKTTAPVITSFSPSTVHAGAVLDPTNNVLTINGSGFGTPTGMAQVSFDHADDGDGGAFYDVEATSPLILSWTSTQIRVMVPSEAGTGVFIVTDAAGASIASSTSINVLFSVQTLFVLGTFREIQLMNSNASGGYSVVYSTSTANSGQNFDLSPAKPSFQRALATWKETSGYNVIEGGTTTNQDIADDGENVIMFDNGLLTPMPAGVLAYCAFTGFSFCGGTTPIQLTDFDIVVRNSGYSIGTTQFTFGPCSPVSSSLSEIDLETVLLHELGHALTLGHVNDTYQGPFPDLNPPKVMNWVFPNGTRRASLDYSAKVGSIYAITPQSLAYGCAPAVTEMVPLATITEPKDECPITFPATRTPNGTVFNFDLVHATSNKYGDPSLSQFQCVPTTTAITNTAYQAVRTGASGGVLSINVTGYGTTPVSQASCSVTGVQLSIYQVNSCPAGESFPAPVACRSFGANGALTDITGLAANTTYLMVVDGIENTKANFNLTFLGAALLPITINKFNGEIHDNYNLLSWITQLSTEVKKVDLERSVDGVQFQSIADLNNLSMNPAGNFKDTRPNLGFNYYRLSITNMDGSHEYSKTVLLQRKDKFLVSVFPNPAKGFFNIEMTGFNTGNYNFLLHNSYGQVVDRKSKTINTNRQSIQINTASLTPGIYQLNIYNYKGELIKVSKVEVVK